MRSFSHTKDLLPEIEQAEERFYEEIGHVDTNDEYLKCVEKFNALLEKAIDALYEDTKDVNSKATFEQTFKARESGETHFGVSPTAVIKRFIGLTPR